MMQDEEQTTESIFTSSTDNESEHAMLQISKWMRQIATIGFAIGTFIVIVMLFSGSQILKTVAESLPIKGASAYSIVVVAFFILFFLSAMVLFYLFKASKLLYAGLQQKNNESLCMAFAYIKKFFIVVVVFAALQLVVNISNLF